MFHLIYINRKLGTYKHKLSIISIMDILAIHLSRQYPTFITLSVDSKPFRLFPYKYNRFLIHPTLESHLYKDLDARHNRSKCTLEDEVSIQHVRFAWHRTPTCWFLAYRLYSYYFYVKRRCIKKILCLRFFVFFFCTHHAPCVTLFGLGLFFFFFLGDR